MSQDAEDWVPDPNAYMGPWKQDPCRLVPVSELEALRREFYALMGRVTALEAEVYKRREVTQSPEQIAKAEEARKAREDRDQRMKETPVEVTPEMWEAAWLNS